MWEDQVNAHVKVCETKRHAERVAKAQLLETSLPYYCRSINGRQTEVCYPDARTISTEQSTGGSTHSAAELSLADPLTWLRKVVEVSEQLFGTRLPRLYREEPQEVLQPFNGGTCAECQHCDVGDDTGNDDEDNGNEQDGDDENMPGGGGGEVNSQETRLLHWTSTDVAFYSEQKLINVINGLDSHSMYLLPSTCVSFSLYSIAFHGCKDSISLGPLTCCPYCHWSGYRHEN